MPPKKRGPFHRAQLAPRLHLPSVRSLGPKCRCGDAAGWHELVDDEFKGRCTYHPCGCLLFRLPEDPDVA